MKKKMTIIVIIPIVLFLLAAFGLFAWLKAQTDNKAIAHKIIGESTPGKTLREIRELLAGQGIKFTYVESDRILRAIVRNVNSRMFVREDVILLFEFDRDEKLMRLVTQSVFTGP